jgi:hypothetical protein
MLKFMGLKYVSYSIIAAGEADKEKFPAMEL